MNSTQIKRKLTHIIFLLFIIGHSCFLLSSCGFHLRGHYLIPNSLKTMSIKSETPFAPFEVALKRRLQQNEVNIVTDGTAAVPTLEILSTNVYRSARAIGQDKRLREVEIQLIVSAQLLDANGQLLMPAENFTQRDAAVFDKNIILGQSEEELQIKQDLREAVIDLIMYRLGAF